MRAIKAGWSRGFVSHITLTCADFLTHAAAVFRAMPVTGVTLSDKRPWANVSDEVAEWWTWLFDIGTDTWRESSLPMGIYWAMKQHNYKTESAALVSLSAAAVTWARREAGLPKLEADRG